MFFLVYHGKGYTLEAVGRMTFDELAWHVRKLNNQLSGENKARQLQLEKMKQQAAARRARSRTRLR